MANRGLYLTQKDIDDSISVHIILGVVIQVDHTSEINFQTDGGDVDINGKIVKVTPINVESKTLHFTRIWVKDKIGAESQFIIPKDVTVRESHKVSICLIGKKGDISSYKFFKFVNHTMGVTENIHTKEELAKFFADIYSYKKYPSRLYILTFLLSIFIVIMQKESNMDDRYFLFCLPILALAIFLQMYNESLYKQLLRAISKKELELPKFLVDNAADKLDNVNTVNPSNDIIISVSKFLNEKFGEGNNRLAESNTAPTNQTNQISQTNQTNNLVCPNCQAKVTADTNFCSKCGFEIKKIRNLICPKCQAENEPDAKFCNMCGSKFE